MRSSTGTRRVILGLVACAALALGAAGCGSDEDDTATTRSTTTAAQVPGRLGVVGYDVDDGFRQLAESAGRQVPERGFVVARIEGNPALRAAGVRDAGAEQNSLQNSDVIETIDGKPATRELLESSQLPGYHGGDVVTLRVWPVDGDPRDVEVELARVEPPRDAGYFPGG